MYTLLSISATICLGLLQTTVSAAPLAKRAEVKTWTNWDCPEDWTRSGTLNGQPLVCDYAGPDVDVVPIPPPSKQCEIRFWWSEQYKVCVRLRQLQKQKYCYYTSKGEQVLVPVQIANLGGDINNNGVFVSSGGSLRGDTRVNAGPLNGLVNAVTGGIVDDAAETIADGVTTGDLQGTVAKLLDNLTAAKDGDGAVAAFANKAANTLVDLKGISTALKGLLGVKPANGALDPKPVISLEDALKSKDAANIVIALTNGQIKDNLAKLVRHYLPGASEELVSNFVSVTTTNNSDTRIRAVAALLAQLDPSHLTKESVWQQITLQLTKV